MLGENGTGKAYEKVIDYIKGKILCGDYQLGQKLPPERELAQILDVSRNSVREAIRTLDILGVLRSQQGAGNYVSSNFEKNLVESMALMFILQKMDYQQLGELRSGIEYKAMELAVDRCSEAQLEEMKKIIQNMRQCQKETANAVLDKKFHFLIAQASQNKLLIAIVQALSEVMDLFILDIRKAILSDKENGVKLQKIHEDIVTCMERKDKEGALYALTAHFELVNQNIAAAIPTRNWKAAGITSIELGENNQ